MPAVAGIGVGKGDQPPTRVTQAPPTKNPDQSHNVENALWLTKGKGKAKLSKDPMQWGIGMVGPSGNKLDPSTATETYNQLRAEKKDAAEEPKSVCLRFLVGLCDKEADTCYYSHNDCAVPLTPLELAHVKTEYGRQKTIRAVIDAKKGIEKGKGNPRPPNSKGKDKGKGKGKTGTRDKSQLPCYVMKNSPTGTCEKTWPCECSHDPLIVWPTAD